ncbi:MAG TPA: hypothetical protein VFN61_05900 [Acidimicrobiales bacterium]|nr:hypothetical protein [Acidimicrobiales bacterium]
MSAVPGTFQQLLDRVPELGPIYQEHLDDNGSVLPHVLMADVARFFNEVLATSLAGSPGSATAAADVRTILEVLEDSMEGAGQDWVEVVSASFLENLDPEDPEYDQARSLMGPRLREMLETVEEG